MLCCRVRTFDMFQYGKGGQQGDRKRVIRWETRQETHSRLRAKRPATGPLLGRARTRAPGQAVQIQVVDPAAVHPRQAQGAGAGSRPPRDAGRGQGRGAGQPQGGPGGRGPAGDPPPLGADIRASGGQGVRDAPTDLELQAPDPMDDDAPHVCTSEDRAEAGGQDHAGRCSWGSCFRSGARSTRRPSGGGSGSEQ